MVENRCEVFSIRRKTLVTEDVSRILTIDEHNKAIFKSFTPGKPIDSEGQKLATYYAYFSQPHHLHACRLNVWGIFNWR